MLFKESLPAVIALAKNAENNDTQWQLILELPNQRKFWLFWYNELVRESALTKIEDLPEEEKLKYWKFVSEETKDTDFSKAEKIDLVKIIWTINYLCIY